MAITRFSTAVLVIGIALLGLASPAGADEQIYRTVDESGRVVFSDTPPASEPAEPVRLPEMNEYDSERPAYLGQPVDDAANPPLQTVRYRTLRIASPGNDEAVRNNAGNVHIEAMSEPDLAPGHTLQLIMDGKVVAANTTGSFDLSNVDRGTHQLEVRIIDDATGKELARSEPSVFHLKRHFIRRKS